MLSSATGEQYFRKRIVFYNMELAAELERKGELERKE
jgi:hypothetical protein